MSFFLIFVVDKKHNLLFIVLVSIFIVSGCQQADTVAEPPSTLTTNDSTALNQAAAQEKVIPSAIQHQSGIVPASISIPKIEIEADVLEVGLNEQRQMEVPEDPFEVGWFQPGTKPGSQGSAVLAGHVDSRTGLAIFFHLDQLEVGDQVYVTDQEGQTLEFKVTSMEIYPYNDAPIDQIFGYTSAKRLNLITCTGEFDRVERTHRERLVVTTELVN
nr:class F sortase [Alkalihalophilus marmarensis]